MRVRKDILSSDKIRQINDANLIIRHFVDLSAKLLPFLAELQSKNELTETEKRNRSKIIDVFNTYNFETETSNILLNSPILSIIKDTYHNILSLESNDPQELLRIFREEYKRLSRNWEYAKMN